MIIADAGYRTPAIARRLLLDGIEPLFPYKRPMTKEGYFRKHDYVYDEYYDCYICPENQVLSYSTTNRDGYREYKSRGYICCNCPQKSKCTESKDHVKLVTQHVWERYIEKAEDIRHTLGNKEIYPETKRNDRTNLWNSERTSWFSIYSVHRKSADRNESRAYFCMHEPEKIS